MMTSRRRRSGAVPAALIVVIAAACSEDAPTAPVSPPDSDASVITATGPLSDHVVVMRARSRPSVAAVAAIRTAGGTVLHRHDEAGVLLVRGLSPASARALARRADVAAVAADRIVQWLPRPGPVRSMERVGAAAAGGGPEAAAFFGPYQWNLRVVNADEAWRTTPQGEGALVCVLDSGIDPTHSDIAGRVDLARSAAFVPEPDLGVPPLRGQLDIIDYRFHGTATAALVASNGIGMASVAPRATICVVKVLNVFGTGPFSALIDGIMHSVAVGADVVNMSLGAYLPRSAPGVPQLVAALERVVDVAVGEGVLLIAAAGNDGADLDNDGDMIHLPSQLSKVLAVSATGPMNQREFDAFAPYSNFGRSGVDAAAPGGTVSMSGNAMDGILSVCSSFNVVLPFPCGPTSYIAGLEGTSFSAPHAAGVAAVIESILPGDQSAQKLRDCLLAGADPVDGNPASRWFGRGRVDVWDSVNDRRCGRALLGSL